jgi:hypothetical protein
LAAFLGLSSPGAPAFGPYGSFAPRSRKKDELAQVVGKKKLARQQAAIFSNPKRYAAFHIAAQVLAMNGFDLQALQSWRNCGRTFERKIQKGGKGEKMKQKFERVAPRLYRRR